MDLNKPMHNSKNEFNYGIDLAKDFIRMDLIQENRRYQNAKPVKYIDIRQIIYIQEGSLIFIKSNQKVSIGKNNIVVIPENIEHLIVFGEQCIGYIITISNLVSEEILYGAGDSELYDSFTNLNAEQLISVNPEDKNFIQSLFTQFKKETDSKQLNKHRNIYSCASIIMTYVFRNFKNNNDGNQSSNSVEKKHFSNFIDIIEKQHTVDRKLTYYAKELGITATHLNRICKNTVKKSASEVVQDYIVKEAKRYLVFTTYSMAEISRLMRFSNPNYFSRYIKANTGHAPIYFRNNRETTNKNQPDS